MSVLSDIQSALTPLHIPVETGAFTDAAPDTFMVVIPHSDAFALFADNAPGYDVQEARISLYAKGSYTSTKNAVVHALLDADFTITDRRYVGYETDTGYHHYVVDVVRHYEMEE